MRARLTSRNRTAPRLAVLWLALCWLTGATSIHGERRPQRPASGTVTVAALSHKPPARARKEFERAMAAHAKRDARAEIAHLERAIELDPAFAEAYHRLGLAYLAADRRQEACDMLQAAIYLDSGTSAMHSNLAVVYATLGRYEDAEKSARTALRIDSTANNSRFLLGLALDGQGREPEEAVRNLDLAAREFPRARIVAARILTRLGERIRAVAELRRYLSSGAVRDRQAVETWVAKLSQ